MSSIFDMATGPTPYWQMGGTPYYRDSLDWLFGLGDSGMPGAPGLQAPPQAPNAPGINPSAPQIPPMPGSLPGMGGPLMPPLPLPPMSPPMSGPPMGVPTNNGALPGRAPNPGPVAPSGRGGSLRSRSSDGG